MVFGDFFQMFLGVFNGFREKFMVLSQPLKKHWMTIRGLGLGKGGGTTIGGPYGKFFMYTN